MKNIFRSFLFSAVVLIAGVAVSCTETKENTGSFQGIPTISVTPASVTVPLAGGTTEPVVVTTPAEWTLDIDADGVIASTTSGVGEAAVTFEVPPTTTMRTIKVTFTATGYVSGFPITKKASLAISQSDSDVPSVDGPFVYYDNCGSAVSKTDDKWPYVEDYAGWAPTGGEGYDQSGVTYTGKNASVRNSGKTWAPVGSTYATDAPYAYLQAKTDTEFVINNIKINSGVKNYTFSFTAFNQYASLIASPYTPVVTPLKSGENLTVAVSTDGTNYGYVEFTTMPDGNWTYAIAPFTLPANADKLYVRFNNYVADTTTALPDATYQYQAALRFDDFRLVEGGDGPVVDFNNAGGTPVESVEATIEQILSKGAGNYILKNAWVVANYGQGYLATDATGKYILCFQGSEAAVPAVGAVVEVNGAVTTYGGLLQFDKTAVTTATGQTKSVDLGTAVAMSGADLDAFISAPVVKYASFEGVLAISGNYYNITIDGASTAVGSISYPAGEMKSALDALNGKGVKVTGFMIGVAQSKYTNMMVTAVAATGNDPDAPEATTAGKIDRIASLTAGTYYMAGYATEYTNSGETTDYSANPYHVWTGKTSTSNGNTDLETAMYSYTDGVLAPGSGVVAQAAVVTLEAVDGKANTYYVNVGGQYLGNTESGTNRRLTLSANKVEWVASDFAAGGIVLSADAVNVGTGKAKTNLIRSYKDASYNTSLQYGLVFFTTDGTPAPNPNPTPDPEPTPDPTPSPEGETTIAEILALGNGATIGSASVEAIVISSMELNNLTSKKGMYVQDATGAMQLRLDADHSFAYGTKVKIDLTGATIGAYNGSVQINGVTTSKITTVSTGNTVEPKTVTMADFLANKYEGQYVAIEGVQVADSDLANTWVVGGAHTSINMVDAAGNKFVVFSSKYATYGAETVAQGSGTIKGISSINNGSMQIIFTQTSDYAGLTGARFDGTTPEPTPDPTPDPTPTPGEGDFGSDSIFVQATDDSALSVYSLGESTINGSSCSGFKLGTSSKCGVFTSKDVAVTGDKTLELYAFAWKGKSAKLYIKVVGGGEASVSEITLTANDGATGNPPYTITAAESDKYTVALTGLTATSTVVFSTAPTFDTAADSTSGRAVVAGVHLK